MTKKKKKMLTILQNVPDSANREGLKGGEEEGQGNMKGEKIQTHTRWERTTRRVAG